MDKYSWMYERDVSEHEKQVFREEFIQKYGCELQFDEDMFYLDQAISTIKSSDVKDVIITDEKYSYDNYITIKDGKNELHIECGCLKAVIEYEITVDSFIGIRTTITFYINPRLFEGEFPYEQCFIANDTMQYDEDRGLLISLDGSRYQEVPIRRSCKSSKINTC